LKLKAAVSDDVLDNYFQLVEEISTKTENKKELEVIMTYISKKLNSKNWKRILKVII
jgi:hypothetical protein